MWKEQCVLIDSAQLRTGRCILRQSLFYEVVNYLSQILNFPKPLLYSFFSLIYKIQIVLGGKINQKIFYNSFGGKTYNELTMCSIGFLFYNIWLEHSEMLQQNLHFHAMNKYYFSKMKSKNKTRKQPSQTSFSWGLQVRQWRLALASIPN